MKYFVYLAVIILAVVGPAVQAGEKVAQNLRPLEPVLAKAAPKIDGILDDEVWSGGPAFDENWVTYNPVNGELLPQRTRVFLAYDPDNLYFAFYCHDTEPGRIKTSLTKRDGMFGDDWVGFSLDASGNRQAGYELFVNPNGVQGDLQLTAAGGEDSAPDWVWYSGGRIVEDGYIVEIRLPLKSIRFSSGESKELGILFWRRISRLSMSGAWPEIQPGKGVFNSMNKIVYGKLESQLMLELLPAMTYSSSWTRLSPQSWSSADDARKIGLGFKYGLTSSITAEATVNPDFSQVESDAFQVTVNQRFPVFYSEKRPFFMDAGSLFQLSAQTGSTNLSRAVHTRFIADPLWGLRLTGDLGPASFGLLASADRSPGLSWGANEENPFLGRKAFFWIGRGKYSLGGDNYIGALYSGREFGTGYNRALAGDLFLRFKKNHRLLATYVFSLTNATDGSGRSQGGHFTAHYIFSNRNTFFGLMGEMADPDFQMDTAFYQRTGFRQAWVSLSHDFQPSPKKLTWLMSISPGIDAMVLHDTVTGLDDKMLSLGLNLQFPLQGNVFFNLNAAQEGWAGREFRKTSYNLGGTLQPIKRLNLHSCGQWGDSIYYSLESPFLGKSLQWHINATLQTTDSLNLYGEYIYCRFNRMDRSRVFDENIIRSRLTYQFNRYVLVRALVQYDSYYKRVLSDFLASFTLIPGTVAHLGYGSLHDKLVWVGGKWEPAVMAGRYYQNRQSLFFKVSYLVQF